MAQLNFEHNWPALGNDAFAFTNATLCIVPLFINDSISWRTVNVGVAEAGTGTVSLSVGLYSLTGSTLTLLNSISGTKASAPGGNTFFGYMSLTVTSASSNITGGQYWLGLLMSTAGGNVSYRGAAQVSGVVAQWPSFVQGRLTSVSTAAMPTSLLTSDLDQAGISMATPSILLTA